MIVKPVIPYLLFVLALYGTPGPSTLSIAASGASYGFKKSVTYIFGIITGLLIIFIMVALGLGILFSTYPTLHTLFKWASLAYVFYLAYKIASAPPLRSREGEHLRYLEGLPLALLNPKAYFAVMATVSQFVDQNTYTQGLIILIIWTLGITTLLDFGWCLAGQLIKQSLSSPKTSKVVNLTFSILLVASVVIASFI